jgi:hypothetical protein
MSEMNTNASRSEHKDAQQVDVGTYHLLQGQVVVGELFVEEDPAHPNDPKHRIEHWCLYSNFAAPSASNPLVNLQFKRLSGQYGSEGDFRMHIKTIQGSRYIKAPCSEMAP